MKLQIVLLSLAAFAEGRLNELKAPPSCPKVSCIDPCFSCEEPGICVTQPTWFDFKGFKCPGCPTLVSCNPLSPPKPRPDDIAPNGPKCGPSTCAFGQECCNESCGICVEPGESCIQIFCGTPDDVAPNGPKCGENTCAFGQECCNESCGICVEKGGSCTQQFCGDLEQLARNGHN